MTSLRSFEISDNGQLDIGFRLRSGAPYTLFSSRYLADKQALLWDESTSVGGSSTFTAARSTVQLTVPTTSGATVKRQTYRYFHQQPGKAYRIKLFAKLNTGKVNLIQRLGLYDGLDGLYFELSGTTLNVVRLNSVSGGSSQTVAQTAWNLDKLNGTGPSGLTLDITKAQVFIIEFCWEIGRIRFGFEYNSQPIYCHELLTSNSLTGPFILAPNLPLRYEILNSLTTASSSTLEQYSEVIEVEGGYQETGTNLAIPRSGTLSYTYNGSIPSMQILGVRLKASYLKKAQVRITGFTFSLISATTSPTVSPITIRLNPTFGIGGSETWNSIANSALEYEEGRTGSVTAGTIVYSGVGVLSSSTNYYPLPNGGIILGSALDGTPQQLILTASNFVVTSTEVFLGSFTWTESY